MRSLTWWMALLTVAFFPLLVSSCADDPEGVGDECDPDGEPCPGELVCEDDGSGETLCQVPPGGRCDPDAGNPYCVDDLVCEPDGEGSGVCGKAEGSECDPTADDPLCAGNLVCAELEDGGYECHQPLLLSGMVFDAATEAAIEGAHVLALDDQATAVTDVAVSAADGTYELSLAVARDADGAPVQAIFTLRASAQDYQTFPSGLRTALPISATDATAEDNGWVVQSAVTDIALLPLPEDEQGLMSISGAVLAEEDSSGVLVVAEGDAMGLSAISDLGGGYTIFNVPDGSYTVRGYAAGVQLEPVEVAMDGAALTGVDLVESSAALGSVSGNIQLVNAPGDAATSVVLVVESTFSDTFVRGEVPRGLRTPLSGPPDVTGDFTIEDVPAGDYVVLAAFENDDLVRDPDPNIAGTQIVHITMPSPGEELTISESFKVTEALPVISPGADEPEAVSSAPTLIWGDDSSEDYYTVVVYNAYGELVWEDDNVPSVSGDDQVSVDYGGPLESGMYYQFRATSWRTPGGTPGPISVTEDLRGVFFVE
ncbi:MAG: hypothetical protein JRI68_21075 [Deltaproteobacteria bacterium]|nr:hypothetical protein [Deltaproteobacteria bacterium]